MGYEVELKFRVIDPANLAARLRDRGAAATNPVEHEDVYFAHPDRDFAATGEAFRIRGEGDTNRITYKGVKLDGPAKTREEIEVEFAAGLDARAELRVILDRLGFQAVAVVRKRRTPYGLQVGSNRLTVTLDEAETLGYFAEVEMLVDDPADLAAGQAAVVALAAELGLTELEPRSYLRMILAARGELG